MDQREGRALLAGLRESLVRAGLTIEAAPCLDVDDHVWWRDFAGRVWHATWNYNGTLNVRSDMTAEQAVEATLASRTCTIEPASTYDEDYGIYTCSVCGEAWQFMAEGPDGNGWTCCPRCRTPIEGAKAWR